MQRPSLFKPLLLLTGAAILLLLMKMAASFLAPILLAVFFATLLSPAYTWMKQRRVPGGLALLLTIGILALAALLMMLLVGKSMTTLASSLASYSDLFSQRQAELTAAVQSIEGTVDLKSLLSAIDPSKLTGALQFALAAVNKIVSTSLLILLITIFILAESSLFILRLNHSFGADHYLTVNINTISQLMVSYFGLRMLVNLATAGATGVMLWLFHIPHAGLWTVLLFFLSFVPYIGAFFAMIPPTLLGFAQGGLGIALSIIVLSVVINSVTENIVAPMVMSKGLSISPTVVFLSFIFWMFILGGAGAFLAMPLTMALLLFMNNFEETHDLAATLMSVPEAEEAKP